MIADSGSLRWAGKSNMLGAGKPSKSLLEYWELFFDMDDLQDSVAR